jgi:hypothetical protein
MCWQNMGRTGGPSVGKPIMSGTLLPTEDKTMRIVLLAFAAIAALLVAVPGAARAQTDPAGASLRVIHAAAGGPGVDIFVDGQQALNSRDFFSESRAPLAPGDHDVMVVAEGGAMASAVIGKRIFVKPGDTYTLALIGAGQNTRGLLLKDPTSNPEPDEARVRIIHAADGVGAVDVAVADGEPFLRNAAFGSVNYIDVPPGSYALDLSAAGTGAGVLRTLPLAFEPGWTYTLVITGDGPDTIWVQALVDRTGS